LFPIASTVLLSVGQYTFDRFQWALQEFGTVPQPDFRSYFSTPDKWLLLLVFSALFEEIIFRGLLQPRFIQRYGLYRGIFLVGVVWAAFHFVSDFSFSGANDWDVPSKLTFRLFMCVTLSFAFGWLALDSGSIFPPAIAHAFYNIFVYSNFGFPFEAKETIRVVLWAGIAFLLFRYCAPSVPGTSERPEEFVERVVDIA
jgi:membrane protease YdiL (CAAX protease family)